ncbi:phosphoribosyltransferase [Patescibacteria group bacterium]|nr:phosphoribosyltransferase [Patescibacteria group bacterium]
MFEDRQDAGQKLAKKLAELDLKDPLIIALPRGGVPVGFEVAKQMRAPLEVLIVRKLGVPGNPEFGFGALASDGTLIVDQNIIDQLDLTGEEIKFVLSREMAELARRQKLYQLPDHSPAVAGREVVLVDDGLATGVSMRAAVQAVLKQNPQKLVVAIPVCSLDATTGIRSQLRPQDEIICLATPLDFSAVGMWYQHFPQTTDEEVINLLNLARKRLEGGRKYGHPGKAGL